ncbi:MAG: AAA family ATPase [Alphaproteobacteria bacterium]|nr:AAA family ATPase [Clostridia bacterium]MBQ2886230.1 AAA family ATPase [Alphaproteobacteria bacterium]
MKIKSIKLCNFRQYKGNHMISFSCDEHRNVSVIVGKNTSGKTTLIQAFNWCLYNNTTFKDKNLLNKELLAELVYGQIAEVVVTIELEHSDIDYTITRTQKYEKINNDIRKAGSSIFVAEKPKSGNSRTYIDAITCEKKINSILPENLSEYFFFDGERIEGIDSKREIVSAVRSLMGLDMLGAAVDHFNSSPRSVVGKLRAGLSAVDDAKLRNLQMEIEKARKEKQDEEGRLPNILNQIEACQREEQRLSELLAESKTVRDKQKERDRLIKDLRATEQMLAEAQNRILLDFNREYFNFFITPLLKKAIKVMDSTTKQVEGIPHMHALSIDHILKRGKCICGCDLTKNQGAVENIQYEKSLLPPHHIGTMIHTCKQRCIDLQSPRDFSGLISDDYAQIRRLTLNRDELAENLKFISQQIMEMGDKNIKDIERDYQLNRNTLNSLLQRKGFTEAKIETLTKDISDKTKQMNVLASQNDKNRLLLRKIAYAEAIYQWLSESYTRQESQVKTNLLQSVNAIFDQIYHGKRHVTLDDNYRIKLLANVGDYKVTSEESKGLEAVKNFSFISGLVDLARKKASHVDGTSSFDESNIDLPTEPYPVVMDAPFSNVDEIHIEKISSVIPTVAEQVVLIIMKKDWEYAKNSIGDRLGMLYEISKVNNSETNSTISLIQGA